MFRLLISLSTQLLNVGKLLRIYHFGSATLHVNICPRTLEATPANYIRCFATIIKLKQEFLVSLP